MSKRSERRHHSKRMKAKARKVSAQSWGYPDNPKAHYYADHLAMCNCMGCGNPRYWFKERTRAEDKFHMSAEEQEHDLWNTKSTS